MARSARAVRRTDRPRPEPIPRRRGSCHGRRPPAPARPFVRRARALGRGCGRPPARARAAPPGTVDHAAAVHDPARGVAHAARSAAEPGSAPDGGRGADRPGGRPFAGPSSEHRRARPGCSPARQPCLLPGGRSASLFCPATPSFLHGRERRPWGRRRTPSTGRRASASPCAPRLGGRPPAARRRASDSQDPARSAFTAPLLPPPAGSAVRIRAADPVLRGDRGRQPGAGSAARSGAASGLDASAPARRCRVSAGRSGGSGIGPAGRRGRTVGTRRASERSIRRDSS